MRSLGSGLAVMIALGATTPLFAQPSTGDIPWIRQALDGVELALQYQSVSRTSFPQFGSLRDDGSQDFTVYMPQRGYIAVGCDEDCHGIMIGRLSGGVIQHREYGQRGAVIYASEEGSYQIRIQVTDCRTEYCYVSVVGAY